MSTESNEKSWWDRSSKSDDDDSITSTIPDTLTHTPTPKKEDSLYNPTTSTMSSEDSLFGSCEELSGDKCDKKYQKIGINEDGMICCFEEAQDLNELKEILSKLSKEQKRDLIRKLAALFVAKTDKKGPDKVKMVFGVRKDLKLNDKELVTHIVQCSIDLYAELKESWNKDLLNAWEKGGSRKTIGNIMNKNNFEKLYRKAVDSGIITKITEKNNETVVIGFITAY